MVQAVPGREAAAAAVTAQTLDSFPEGGVAIVLGASGGIGAAVLEALATSARFSRVIGYHRRSVPPLELGDEDSIAAIAAEVRGLCLPLRLVFDATGVLQEDGIAPEKSWRQLDSGGLARVFAVNAIGPALLMKHLLPLLEREGKSVFATLSAKVGSIGDNQLGGWYGYRASKAALNQFVRTASIELARQRREAICVALHPGTVDTNLSAPHAKTGLEVRTPAAAAALLLEVLDDLTPADTGGFFDYRGEPLPW
jgi:NAD(P)-dependent dehydrogenase (short-subunit alcohol dehydrogenase family)